MLGYKCSALSQRFLFYRGIHVSLSTFAQMYLSCVDRVKPITVATGYIHGAWCSHWRASHDDQLTVTFLNDLETGQNP